MSDRNFWIGVVSRAHVKIGVEGGFIQLNHGKKAPLQRFRQGDGLLIYSPKESFPDGEPCQSFTALGFVKTGAIYQVEMTPDFHPYRIDIEFAKCAEAPIKPLIANLSFITDKSHWGAPFRFGMLKIPEIDFTLIAQAMGYELPETPYSSQAILPL